MNFVEGISDDVLCLGIALIAVFIGWLYVVLNKLGVQNRDIDDSDDPNEESAPPVHNPNTCPICWNRQTLALETNCGHLYCGLCLVALHERDTTSALHGIKCPMCRQSVVLLFQCFTPQEKTAEASTETANNRIRVRLFAQTYNRIHSTGERTLMDRIREIPVLLRHLYNEISETGFGDFYLSIRLYLILLLSIIYVLLPSDILPERIFGFVGFIDDLVLLLIFSCYLASMYRQYLTGME